MTVGQFTIELLKILFGSGTVTGVILITFMCIFKSELKALIERIASVKFPGGEVTTSQAERGVALAKTEVPTRQPHPTNNPELAASSQLSPEDQQRLSELLAAENTRALFWEYQFLSKFLVFNTQKILDWFASLPQRTSLQMYDSFWTPIIQDPIERSAIISALQNHYLIEIVGGLVEVTPKGRDYLQWRGPIAPAP